MRGIVRGGVPVLTGPLTRSPRLYDRLVLRDLDQKRLFFFETSPLFYHCIVPNGNCTSSRSRRRRIELLEWMDDWRRGNLVLQSFACEYLGYRQDAKKNLRASEAGFNPLHPTPFVLLHSTDKRRRMMDLWMTQSRSSLVSCVCYRDCKRVAS